MNANTITAPAITLNDQEIDRNTITVEGIDRFDYPKFCDAFISSARFVSGIELNDKELEQLTEENYDLINQLATESMFAL